MLFTQHFHQPDGGLTPPLSQRRLWGDGSRGVSTAQPTVQPQLPGNHQPGFLFGSDARRQGRRRAGAKNSISDVCRRNLSPFPVLMLDVDTGGGGSRSCDLGPLYCKHRTGKCRLRRACCTLAASHGQIKRTYILIGAA